MISIFKLLMFSLLFILGGWLFWSFVKYFVTYNKFTDYLFSIDDKDTLRKIGRLDLFDQRRFATIPFPIVHKVLLEKYEKTNDDKYILFDEQYMKYAKQIMTLAILLFLLYVFYQIISYGLS